MNKCQSQLINKCREFVRKGVPQKQENQGIWNWESGGRGMRRDRPY